MCLKAITNWRQYIVGTHMTMTVSMQEVQEEELGLVKPPEIQGHEFSMCSFFYCGKSDRLRVQII